MAAGLALAWPGAACAADLVFTNGQRLDGVRVLARTDTALSVEVPSGVVRYPIASIAFINGRPASEVLQTVPVVPEATPPPAPTPEPGLPAATPTPEATATPALVTSDAVAPAVTPAPAPATPSDRWHFELLLVALFAIAAAWMRGLHAVQRDLFTRRVDPRGWTLAASLVPVLGAAAYFLTRRFEGSLAKLPKRAPTPKPAAEEKPKPTGAGLFGLGRPKAADPAEHLARKGRTRPGMTFLDSDRQSVIIKDKNGELASGLENANELVEEAILERASDVHIEPTSDGYRARFRLDGVLHARTSYDQVDGIRLVTALKALAQIDVAEKRKAQDGKFRVKLDDREVDFRVATATSIHGEKMVIRVLDHRGGIFDLTALGMPDEMLATFQQVIHSRNGMILATGPTGSGKTSTLYAALSQLDANSLNIMTIEDPAEYELAGATQIAVNPRAGITYEAGLRSILRQDPDVIFVGEMRDAEAATIAVRSALTGHLVFSTLHTKDAIGTVTRLQDMGIERYQLASALLMVVAQRLVRVLCPHCRREYPAQGHELEALGFWLEAGRPLYAPQGCDQCNGTGYQGRTGIFELLVLDEDFRRVIGEGADESAIMEMALERDFKSFRYDGAQKALMGITTVDEVLQAS